MFGVTLDSLKEAIKEARGVGGSTSLSFTSPPTMASYELKYTVSSPGSYTTLIEFSPDGRFIAVGDRDLSSLYLLDKRAGFHPTLSVVTPSKPTALVWESSEAFYVGLADGCFVHYRIDLAGGELVEGVSDHLFRGTFPTTAMALDMDSKTLVLSVGPEVFAFRRVRATSRFHSSMNSSIKLIFLEANSVSSPTYQTGSILRAILEDQFLRFRELYALPPTTHSW
jgi:WD40 repeat protein